MLEQLLTIEIVQILSKDIVQSLIWKIKQPLLKISRILYLLFVLDVTLRDS